MNLPFRSLTFRVVAAVALILAAAGGIIGAALYRSIRHAVIEEAESKLRQRIAWLQVSVEIGDEGNLEFEPKQALSSLPPHWRIATAQGRVLWESQWNVEDGAFMAKSKPTVLG